jgi:hypothetical protein
MDEDEDLIEFSEESERSWRQYMSEFRDKVYPMFERYGFTYAEAMITWRLERIITSIDADK